MSSTDDDKGGDGDAKVGYGNPPAEHRFKKGVSGNPRGRPRKQERSLTGMQIRRDWLGLLEELTKVKTSKGQKNISYIEALRLKLLQKGLSGHGPSIRLLLKMYDSAVAEHNRLYKFSFLEMVETENVKKPVPPENARLNDEFINKLRKETKRI